MIGRDPLGRWTCDEHPRARWADEYQAAEHLRVEHPDLWARLVEVRIRPVGDVIDTTGRET